MTAEEKQEITNEVLYRVLEAIRTNSVKIEDLVETSEIPDSSYLELSGGKKARVDRLKSSLKTAIVNDVVLPVIGSTVIVRGSGEGSVMQVGESRSNRANGSDSAAFGQDNKAQGNGSFTEGYHNEAKETASHAGGSYSESGGKRSFAHGLGLVTKNECEAAFGRCNATTDTGPAGDRTLFAVGNGEFDETEKVATLRRNAFEVTQDGSIYIWYGDTEENVSRVKLQDLLATLMQDVSSIIDGAASGGYEAPAWNDGDIEDNESQESGSAGVSYWYVGQITRTAAQFAALTGAQLLENAERQATTEKQKDFRIIHSCWYVIVPEGVEVDSAKYTAGGLETNFTDTEITGDFASGVYHGDFVDNGVTYHVYVNRNTALVGSNAEARIILK